MSGSSGSTYVIQHHLCGLRLSQQDHDGGTVGCTGTRPLDIDVVWYTGQGTLVLYRGCPEQHEGIPTVARQHMNDLSLDRQQIGRTRSPLQQYGCTPVFWVVVLQHRALAEMDVISQQTGLKPGMSILPLPLFRQQPSPIRQHLVPPSVLQHVVPAIGLCCISPLTHADFTKSYPLVPQHSGVSPVFCWTYLFAQHMWYFES